tara:strand:- start:2440 stop:2862 length:423 start_codon:yes stop_codon:yes gene_type:complete
MGNVVIDISTISNANVIEVIEKVNAVEITSETTTNNNNIDVNNTIINSEINVETLEVRAVTIEVEGGVFFASESVSGKSKLYDSLGENTDGSVTQKEIKGNLNLKTDKIDEHELISLASLIHRTRMSIRQDNMNMKLILR